MKVQIRDYYACDFSSLQSLWEQTGLDQPGRGDSEEVIDRCNAPGGKLLLMENQDSGEIIGSSWMTWEGRRIYLHHQVRKLNTAVKRFYERLVFFHLPIMIFT